VTVQAIYKDREDALVRGNAPRVPGGAHDYVPFYLLSRSTKEAFEAQRVLDVLEGD
jgi:hypothetical protein